MIKTGKKGVSINTTRLIVLGFMFVIMIGAFLLALPISSASHTFTNPIDALFTATTSVCVTGLTTITTATSWSFIGKIIILCLIQLGGLGVICCMLLVIMTFKVRISMKETIMVQESYGFDNINGMNRIIPKVVKGTAIVEGIGAICYSFYFIPEYGVARGIWYSVFHSISAFCNAGIDLLGDNSFESLVHNDWMNIITMFLIVAGGIGFIVWWDVKDVVKHAFKIRKFKGQLFNKLSLHSKVALVVSFVLIFGGALLIFIFEFNNPETIGDFSIKDKIMSSLFQSVTLRTAGFAEISQSSFRNCSYFIILILMIIGGSPMGTAGGLKTTTVAMMFFCVIGIIKGKKDTEVFNRRIESSNIKTGLSVIVIGLTMLVCGMIALSITDGFTGMETAFECFSALGTVGLTMGITSSLSLAGKIVIIIMMFIGRIGPITIAMAIGGRKVNNEDTRKLAHKKIIVG